MTAQDALTRRALEYHTRPDRGPSCGSMAADMDLILRGLVDFTSDGRLELTRKGHALLAQGGEAGTAETHSGSVHEHPVAKPCAQQPEDQS